MKSMYIAYKHRPNPGEPSCICSKCHEPIMLYQPAKSGTVPVGGQTRHMVFHEACSEAVPEKMHQIPVYLVTDNLHFGSDPYRQIEEMKNAILGKSKNSQAFSNLEGISSGAMVQSFLMIRDVIRKICEQIGVNPITDLRQLASYKGFNSPEELTLNIIVLSIEEITNSFESSLIGNLKDAALLPVSTHQLMEQVQKIIDGFKIGQPETGPLGEVGDIVYISHAEQPLSPCLGCKFYDNSIPGQPAVCLQRVWTEDEDMIKAGMDCEKFKDLES